MLTRVLRTVRLDTIDQRSAVGVALRRLREELFSDLGGDVTAAQRVLIEEAAKARVIAAAVGDWVLRQESLVKDGELLPAVLQHSALVANLGRLLERLGLRRAHDKPDGLRHGVRVPEPRVHVPQRHGCTPRVTRPNGPQKRRHHRLK